MILILRGHIRESFEDNNLLLLIEYIYKIYPDLTIYIHTWNVFSNNISWRNIKENNNDVNEEIIYDYFGKFRILIKHIIIGNDKNITLHGRTFGKLFNSSMPIVGWKNYWYGKYQITKYLYDNIENKDSPIINCRIDVLKNSFSFNVNNILQFIYSNKNRKFIGNEFIFDKPKEGIDNIYMGSVKTMYILTRCFHKDLDKISSMYPHIKNQEFSVFMLNNFILKKIIVVEPSKVEFNRKKSIIKMSII
jgi:hypothetical protein